VLRWNTPGILRDIASLDNAFNTSYVPIAFNLYDGSPSINGRTGYVGESGPPLTFGFRGGIYF
jgi:hypothetical protein